MSLRLFGGVTLGVVLGGCASIPIPDLPFVDDVPEGVTYLSYLESNGEIAKLATVAATKVTPVTSRNFASVKGNEELIDSPVLGKSKVRQELHDLARCMAGNWPGMTPQFDLLISSNMSPGASALPNEIQVNLGLIGAAGINGDEIAFVLAHELAHVVLYHYERAEFNKSQEALANKMTQVAIAASVMAEIAASRQGDQIVFGIKDEDKATAGMVKAATAYVASQMIADGVIESGWSREQELNADRLGVDIAVLSGLGAGGAFEVLNRIDTFESGRKSELEKFEKQASDGMDEAIASGDVNTFVQSGLENVQTGIVAGIKDVWRWISSSHPSAAKRSAELSPYAEPRYILADASEVQVAQRCDAERVARAISTASDVEKAANALRSAAFANRAAADGRGEEARSHAKKAIGKRTGLPGHPVTQMAAYTAEMAAGDDRKALRHLRNVRLNKSVPITVFATLGAEYLRHDQPKRAEEVVAVAERYYPPDVFLPLKMQAADALGNVARFEALSATCSASQSKALVAQCGRVAAVRRDARGDVSAVESATGAGQSIGGAAQSAGDAIKKIWPFNK